MSTFDGRIREYPAIAVDNFQPTRPGVRIFLLSHVHADHLSGLDSRSFNIPLYCSEDTAKLLPAVRAEVSEPGTKKRSPAGKYTHLKPFLKPLEYQEPTQICIGAETITLTLFTANHCPGSTMFLIEGSKGNVVYTGDMRAEDWFLDTLESHMSSFSNILHVYLDTTFCHESFADFPSKSRSIEAFMEVIRQYDAETCFVIGYNILGVEPIWDRIYEDYGEKVHTIVRSTQRLSSF
ncbi:beta-lactamase-like protein [Fimicolochytrium jonesii]|uniref:beta-lactamase-like protein n=1 Tax=Fimicolochytrium jonesii TaxID=1396493 RepID=UPI0022FE430E|nr:beta-lactamase-like protein [Fimicolochytrium jonesii]KAI8817963.1 beta-lactamase-like protein [Fimicolochytrium jonesii]